MTASITAKIGPSWDVLHDPGDPMGTAPFHPILGVPDRKLLKTGTLLNQANVLWHDSNTLVTVATPATTPTVAVTGGGSTGGALQVGAYYLKYTFTSVRGETAPSPESLQFTVAAGNIPRVTLPSLPTGATGIDVYITAAAGATGTETLYASAITATTYDLKTAQSTGAAMPGANTATVATVQYDLYAVVKDMFGATCNFRRGKFLVVMNDSDNDTVAANELLIDGTVANAWSRPFGGIATAKLLIPPSGHVQYGGPLATALPITSTSKILTLDAQTYLIPYRVALLGVNA